MAAALGAERLDGLLDAARGAIDAVGREGVERVGDGGDAPGQRDLLAREAARVAGAVVALVMGERDLGRGVEQLDARAGQHRVPEGRVRLELAPLARGERPGLAGDRVRDRGHADVVQAARDPDQIRV